MHIFFSFFFSGFPNVIYVIIYVFSPAQWVAGQVNGERLKSRNCQLKMRKRNYAAHILIFNTVLGHVDHVKMDLRSLTYCNPAFLPIGLEQTRPFQLT